MKNKKGFTLVELICMIGILVVIIGIFSLNMINSLKNNKREEQLNVITQIKSAADAYVSANPGVIEDLYKGYGYVDIPVGDLRNAGLLSEDIKDPETGEIIPDDEIVRVILNQGDYMEFIYPVEDDQDAWVMVAEPLTVQYNSSISNWCSDDNLVYSGLITNPGDPNYADIQSKLYLMDNRVNMPDRARMYTGNYFDVNGVNLRVDEKSCNVDTSKEGTYNITYVYKDPDLGTEKRQNRVVYVAADSTDIISFEVISINNDQPIMQLLPEGPIKIVIRENLRGNATRTIETTIGELNNKGYRIANFSTKDIALNNSKKAIVSSNRVNSDGSTPEAKEKPYTVVPAKYDIYFDAQGGSATKTQLTVEYNKRYDAYGTFPTASKTGYKFLGWFTQAVGGTQIDGSVVVSDPSVRTLYAHWEGNPYTVTYSGNGGTPSSTSATVIFGSNYTVPSSNPTRSGYDFIGWYTTSNYQSGREITNSSIVDQPRNHTIYAGWRGKPYTVYFDPNGGSPSGIITTTQYFDSFYTLPSTPTPPTGYYFVGWYTSPSGGSQVTSSTRVTTAATHTLYARYNEITYTLNYNANGGSVSPTYKLFRYSGDRTYGSLPTPTKTGYSYTGWYTSSSGGSQVSSSTYLYGDTTIYAHWQIQYYQITYNSNGGSPSVVKTETKSYGGYYNPPSAPTKSGYIFDGWYTSAYGGTSVTSSTRMTQTTDHTIYAHWKKEQVTITFINRDTGARITKSADKGSYVSFPNSWTKCAHKISHWCKNTTSCSRTDGITGGITANGNATYYAVWTGNYNDCNNISGCSDFIERMQMNSTAWQTMKALNEPKTALDAMHDCNINIIRSKWGTGTALSYSNGALYAWTTNASKKISPLSRTYFICTNGSGWYATTTKPTSASQCTSQGKPLYNRP